MQMLGNGATSRRKRYGSLEMIGACTQGFVGILVKLRQITQIGSVRRVLKCSRIMSTISEKVAHFNPYSCIEKSFKRILPQQDPKSDLSNEKNLVV